jgi:hypothetical protein
MHYEGDVTAEGGDYVDVPFDLPAGTVEIQVTHTYGSDTVILDWGVCSPEWFRGLCGGLTDDSIIALRSRSMKFSRGIGAGMTYACACPAGVAMVMVSPRSP